MRPNRIALALVGLAVVIAAAALVLGGADDRGASATPAVAPDADVPERDPLVWTPERSAEYAERAAAGLAHPLYARTPDGIVDAAERTASWRPLVERAAEEHGVDADTLEAMMLLESAGRPEAQASDDLAGAVGLMQILAETGANLLGLRVDLAESRRVTRRMTRAAKRGRSDRLERLRAERRRVDERFDPAKSLDAAGRYLEIARGHLERVDLAVASYHMGIGNLQTALERYGEGIVPYAQLYFDVSPAHASDAWEFLAGLGDDSPTYLWRVEAAREIMRLHRHDREELARRDALMTARNSAEVLLHPPDAVDPYDDAEELGEAHDEGEIVPLPRDYLARHGLRVDGQMGELAPRVDAEPTLYRGLRREALAVLAYLGAGVRRLSGSDRPLRVTSSVRDERYQEALRGVEREATHGYSLHTTGYAFDVARDYAGREQARAFQFLLDRLTALNLIAWVREPGAIHVTVSADATEIMAPMGVLPDED